MTHTPSPEVLAEAAILRQREQVRYGYFQREQERIRGLGGYIPEAFERSSEADLIAQAERNVARRKAWRETPEGRASAEINRLKTLADEALNREAWDLLERASEAFSRGWSTNQSTITDLISQAGAVLKQREAA
jgi:hypothetical protein